MKKILILLICLLCYVSLSSEGIKNVNGVPSLAAGTYTEHIHITSSELGKNVTNPPVVDHYGITKVAEFTVNTDKVSYKYLIPLTYASGDLSIHLNWTRSTTGGDESGKTVKWQVKNLVINGTSENCNSGEITNDAIQDVYDASSTTTQIVYQTESITIGSAEFTNGELLIIEIMAVTVDSGVALSEPALVSIGFEFTSNKVKK